jgi:sulfonate transport system permease protein
VAAPADTTRGDPGLQSAGHAANTPSTLSLSAAAGARATGGIGTTPHVRSRIPGWARLISLAVVIGLWQAASSTHLLPASKLAAPVTIAHTAYLLIVTNNPTYGTLQASLLVSAQRWAIGLSIGTVLGVLLGVISGLSRIGEIAFDPILQALRSIPLLGMIPLFIIWFGIGEMPKDIIVTLAALFLMYINTFAGIRGVDPKLGELAHVLGLKRRELIRHIVLPGALPQILTGLRLAVVASLLALVVGEQINANAGLGYMITQAENFLQNNVVVVALIVYAILGTLVDAAVRLLERKALSWRRGFVEF